MSVQLVVDMNLSPEWIVELARHGWSAVHWSTVGNPRADDSTIMAWAVANRYVVFTHDLDFGTTLALTHVSGPSVLQIRGQNVLPEHMDPVVVAALRLHDTALAAGALVVVDESKARLRLLPHVIPKAGRIEPNRFPLERVRSCRAPGFPPKACWSSPVSAGT